tara:strand:+ start:28456 stop:28977 length:522 start_codon:yes stop_codon:yes gene_type:complete
MAGVGLAVEIKADAALAALGKAEAKTEQPRDLYDAIGLALLASTDYRFETEQSPDKTPWPKSMRVLLEGGKTLTDSGHFRSSMAHEATDTGVAVGTNAIQGAIHQFGGVIRAKNAKALAFSIGGEKVFVQSVTMPARPYLGLSDDDEADIIALAGDWLTEPLGSSTEQVGVDG